MKQLNLEKPMSDSSISAVWERAMRLSEIYGLIYVYFYDDGDGNVYDLLIDKERNRKAEQLGYTMIGYYENGDFTKA